MVVVVAGADSAIAAAGAPPAAASSVSLFRLFDFLESEMSMSSNDSSLLMMIISSSPMISTATVLPAWLMAVLVRVGWLRLTLVVGGKEEALPA